MSSAISAQAVSPAIPQSQVDSLFNPEFDFLLGCCASGSQSQGAERIRDIVRHPQDCKRLVDLAEHHGVIPQVYRSLSVLSDVALPDSLRQSQERNARQTLWLTRELLRILEKLDSYGIPALP